MFGVFRMDEDVSKKVDLEKYLKDYSCYILGDASTIRFGKDSTAGFIAYPVDLSPRPIMAGTCGICCFYRGQLKSPEADELHLMLSSYKYVKENAKKSSFRINENGNLAGNYDCIICDNVQRSGSKSIFLVHCFRDTELMYGADSEGFIIVTDCLPLMEKVCKDSYERVPHGGGILINGSAVPREPPLEASFSAGINLKE
ncbi:hypothetical protein QQ045_009943 [Rhodiola kirilowii]